MKLLGTSAIVLTLGVGAAMAQEACKSYRVAPGDTLLKIAQQAYGNGNYRMIYEANTDRIGSNPNLIEVGSLLRLPCADGTVAEAAPAVVPEATEAAKEAAASDEGPIVLITGNDFPPFTDEGLPGRGVFTQLVETAAFRADAENKVEVKFVNDWDSHLDLLLPVLAFNGSFPWSKPECDQPDSLSEHDKSRCENYLFSDPFYEVVDGFFARKGTGFDSALKYEELLGTRICRPEGYSTAHLDAAGLSEPMVKMYRPDQVRDCFDGLMAGSVDVISIDSMVAADTISTLGLTDQVVENQNLGAVKELYVLVHKNHPRGQETLDLLNAGLREMVSSGEWYDIVSTALQRQMAEKVN
ncbi:MAG: transporter substrate-binding domain-containing protein [Albidovulum sp.]|uniref:peptidoglycan-binding protein LysM n=1 Tax=Albidovulum sp. TaxID=1872424 RepID=UPI003C893FA6